MFEAVVTFVSMETQDGLTYPVTKLSRIEFESEGNFFDWLGEAERFSTNVEQLIAAPDATYTL